jgi:hypothetical protein
MQGFARTGTTWNVNGCIRALAWRYARLQHFQDDESPAEETKYLLQVLPKIPLAARLRSQQPLAIPEDLRFGSWDECRPALQAARHCSLGQFPRGN